MTSKTATFLTATAITTVVLLVASLAFVNVPPYGMIDCRWDGDDLAGMTYSTQPDWPDLERVEHRTVTAGNLTLRLESRWDYARGHCLARRDATSPLAYDIRQKAEYLVNGEVRPPEPYADEVSPMSMDEWENTTYYVAVNGSEGWA